MSAADPASSPHRRLAIGLCGCATFVNLYTPQSILPALTTEFAVPAAQTGLSVTAPLLAVALIAPFAGAISDRLGRRRIILAACLILVLPTLLAATAQSLETLLFWRFLQGVTLPFIFTVAVAYVADECQGAEAVRAVTAYAMGSIIGGFGGRFIAGLVSTAAGWRWAFVAVAGLTLLGTALIALWLPPERRFVALRGGLGATFRAYRAHLGNTALLGTCAVGFCMLFSNVAVFTFVNFHLSAPPHSLSAAELGLVFTVYLLGLVTTSIAAPITVRLGRLPTLALTVTLAGAGLLLTLAPSTALAILGLAGLCGGLFVVQGLSLGHIGVAVTSAKSSAVGLYVTIFYIGGALGGVVPGLAFHTAGWPGVVALVLALLIAIPLIARATWRP